MERRYRTYSELEQPDHSGLPEQITAQRARVDVRLAGVRRAIAVMSGKGGVGKSLISAAFGAVLGRDGRSVGLLDADLHSPTAARMCGADPGPLTVTERGVRPASSRSAVVIMSMELLLPEGAPLAWHGPAGDGFVWQGAEEHRALREFISDVDWGPLDWLIIDLPPGTRTMIDLLELVPRLDGLVVATLPVEAARASAGRALSLARERGVPLLGVVENMTGYACPECDEIQPLFPGDGGCDLATSFAAPLLGRIPFDPGAAALADRGEMETLLTTTACGRALHAAADRLLIEVEGR